MRNRRYLAPVFLTLALGCSGQKGDTGPTGPPGPTLTGTLIGSVSLYTQCGSAQTHDGVLITIEGTTRSTTSDATGRWEFSQLPTGTYVFAFSKPGYGTYKTFGYQFTGGGTAYHGCYLIAIPTGVASNLSVAATTVAGYAGISVTFDTPPCPSNCSGGGLVVVGSDVGSLSPSNYLMASPTSGCSGGNQTLFLSTSGGYTAGLTVYVKAYVADRNGGYYDPAVGRMIYTAVSLSPAPIASIVLP